MELAKPIKKMRIDGRWFLWGSHLLLFWVGFFLYGLQRSVFQFATAYVAAAITDVVLNAWLKKYPSAGKRDRILSAVSEAAGLLILINSSLPYYYAAGSVIAVASKYFLTRHDGVHIFNPTNFAIVLGLAIFPISTFSIWPDEFSLSFYPIMHVLAFGTFAVIFGRAYWITIGYFTGLLIVSAVMGIATPDGFMKTFFPELGAFGIIFAFLMITDPRTTPGRNSFKMVFGVVVAFVMLTLKSKEVCYPHYVALFIVTTAMYALSFRFPQIYRKPLNVPDPASGRTVAQTRAA